jgi:type IV secretory pathway TrbL component
MTGTVVAVCTDTAVGQRMRYSEMALKSMDGSAAAGATEVAGAGATATTVGAGGATGEEALGAAGTVGMTTGAEATATSIGRAADSLRLTTTLKLGVKKRMPPAPTIAPKRKRIRPRKNAAIEVFRSPP